MALNNLGMGFIFTATNLASSTFRGMSRDFTQMERATTAGAARIDRAMKQVKAGFMLAGAGAVGLGASFAIAGAAGKFEQGLAGVGAITSATTEELRKLEQAAIDAGIKTQFSPTEAIDGLRTLGQAGLNATEGIAVLQPSLDLAAGSLGQLSVEESAGLAVQGMKSFGISAEEAGFAVDQMLKTTNKFAISAKELPLAFGIASRGALAMNASLADTAISLGLAKNIMPSVERASTSVAVAMERLARKQGQQKLETLFGVKAIDKQTGKFRGFLDIVGDMIDKTKTMTEVQKSNAMAQIFGARAGGGIKAILQQLTTGIKDNNGQLLKGKAAIEFYRKEMENAGGTAAKFRKALLDTFEGQKTLLRGSIQTAAVVFGKPFAKVFAPAVTMITEALNKVIGAWQSLSDKTKDVIAKFVVFTSSAALITGIVLLVKGALTLLGVTIGGIAATVASALVSLLPFALVLAGIALAVKGFAVAIRKDIGGVGTFFKQTWKTVKLFFQAMVQLFSDGGFSGEVRKELNKTENQGIKAFAIKLFVWFGRIKSFFSGMADGLGAALDAMSPAIDGVLMAFRRLGQALGFITEGPASPDENAKAFDRWGQVGERVGVVVGWLAEKFVNVLTFAINVVTAAVGMMGGEAVRTGAMSEGAAMVIVGAFNIVKGIITAVWAVVSTVFEGWSLLLQALSGDLIDWGETWVGVKLVVFNVIEGIIDAVMMLPKMTARALDAVARLVGKDLGLEAKVESMSRSVKGAVAKSFGPEVAKDFEASTAAAPTAKAEVTQRLAATAIRPGASAAETANITARLKAGQEAGFTDEQLEKLAKKIAEEQKPVVLQVDGETMAETVSRAGNRAAGRSFAPVPTG